MLVQAPMRPAYGFEGSMRPENRPHVLGKAATQGVSSGGCGRTWKAKAEEVAGRRGRGAAMEVAWVRGAMEPGRPAEVSFSSAAAHTTITKMFHRSLSLLPSFPPSAPLSLPPPLFPFLGPSFPPSSPLSLPWPLFPSLGPSFPPSAPLSLLRPLFPSLVPSFPPSSPLSLPRPLFPSLVPSFPPSAPLSLPRPLFPSLGPSFPPSSPLSLPRPLFPSFVPSFPPSSPLSPPRPLFPSLVPSFPRFSPLSLSFPFFPRSLHRISHTLPLNPSLDPFSHLTVPHSLCAWHPHPFTLDLLAGDLLHALKRGIGVILSPDKLLVPVRHERDGMSNIGALGEVDDEGQHLHHGTMLRR
ncbi:unnamed protein product [Closterium sp. NIES-64]|nr:unnamed protein product [Closterium sp. NIES-64]